MRKVIVESYSHEEAEAKTKSNRKMQKIIISLTILQGFLIVVFGMYERKQIRLNNLAANICITIAILLKIIIDPIVLWISFQVTHFLIERMLTSTQD